MANNTDPRIEKTRQKSIFYFHTTQLLLDEIELMARGSETNSQLSHGKMDNLYSLFSFASFRYPPERMEGLFCLVAEAIHYLKFILAIIENDPVPGGREVKRLKFIAWWTNALLRYQLGIIAHPSTSPEFRRNVELWQRWLDIASQLNKELGKKEKAAFVAGTEFVLRVCVACGFEEE